MSEPATYCPYCGRPVADTSARFCAGCGRALPGTDPVEPTAVPTSLQDTKVSPPSPTSQLPVPAEPAAEWGFVWTFLLSPIAGAVFWSRLWKRNGFPNNVWWTWVTAVIAFVLELLLLFQPGSAPWALGVNVAWQLAVYGTVRRTTASGNPAMAPIVVACMLLLVEGVWTAAIQSYGTVTVGSVFHRNSNTLAVSGSNYRPNVPFYARVATPGAFGTTRLTFLVQKQEGAGWREIADRVSTVAPNDNVEVEPFSVTAPGTYEVQVLIHNTLLGQAIFSVRP